MNKITSAQGYDSARLAELSKLAIGGRTIREFSNVSGLSEGFLSRLTTGKLKSAPTLRSLSKLTSEASRPQNNISLADVKIAAGYQSPRTISPQQAKKAVPSEEKDVPCDVLTAAFPAYLTASTLEESGQLSHRYTSENQREMFVISSMGNKDIVGIPAFCSSSAVEKTIREAKRNLLMAYSIFDEDIKDKFVVILTNQTEFYDAFDKNRPVGTGGEFYIALTQDFHSFTRQRPVQANNLDGEAVFDPNEEPTFKLTV